MRSLSTRDTWPLKPSLSASSCEGAAGGCNSGDVDAELGYKKKKMSNLIPLQEAILKEDGEGWVKWVSIITAILLLGMLKDAIAFFKYVFTCQLHEAAKTGNLAKVQKYLNEPLTKLQPPTSQVAVFPKRT